MNTQYTVWICGAFGKMGNTLRAAIEETDDIIITGVVSPEHLGQKCSTNGVELEVFESLEAISSTTSSPDVIVDFTFADVAYADALFAAEKGIHFVTGTTGLGETQKSEIITAYANSKAHAIIASNFSVGAVLMMHFAAQAAQYFTHAEIIEMHHTQKMDAPSGTAITTQTMMSEQSNMNASEIPIHSLRLPGAIAHQQVHLSSQGEILRIEHDANDRTCFMPGILLAIRNVKTIDGVSFSIEALLFPDNK